MSKLLASFVILCLLSLSNGCTLNEKQNETSHSVRLESIHSSSISDHNSIIRLNTDYTIFGKWWLQESKKRFNNPIILLCHGGYNRFNEWCYFPDNSETNGKLVSFSEAKSVESLAEKLHSIYPENQVILITCNERGLTPFHIPNVYYFKQSVWKVPDSFNFCGMFLGFGSHETKSDYKESGSIWEAVN